MRGNSGCWDDGADEALFREAATASEERRTAIHQQLVLRHSGLAVSIAKRTSGANFTEDIRQVALFGLVKAVRSFDPDRGFPFASYAGPTISGEVKRYFRDKGWLVRPPRSVQENVGVLSSLRENLRQDLGREPRPEDYAHQSGLRTAQVTEALRAAAGMYGESLQMYETDHGTAHNAIEEVELSLDLQRALGVLTPQQRQIIEMRFVRDATQREIAEITGVSQMQISRQITAILRELRSAITDKAA